MSEEGETKGTDLSLTETPLKVVMEVEALPQSSCRTFRCRRRLPAYCLPRQNNTKRDAERDALYDGNKLRNEMGNDERNEMQKEMRNEMRENGFKNRDAFFEIGPHIKLRFSTLSLPRTKADDALASTCKMTKRNVRRIS